MQSVYVVIYCHLCLIWLYMALPYFAHCLVRFGNTLPRRQGVRTVLCKIESSASNRRRADAADQSRSRPAADICFGDRFARRTTRDGGRNHWKVNWKSAGLLVRLKFYAEIDGDIRPSVPPSHWFRASTTVFFFYNSVLIEEEEVLPHRNWTSWIKKK